MVNGHKLAELFKPLSVPEAIGTLGTDRQIDQRVVDASGEEIGGLFKTLQDILVVRILVPQHQSLVVWGDEPKQPDTWNVLRYTRLGKEYDGSLKIRKEEEYTK
ncbi:hypothetical protein HYX03_01850 [Candidatus Woesearchaeota archaeon]|nr:hypothetical protein [Candidatus Woesearchaeota archaeon]